MCCRKRFHELAYLLLQEFHCAPEHHYFTLALAFITTEAKERGIVFVLVACNSNTCTVAMYPLLTFATAKQRFILANH